MKKRILYILTSLLILTGVWYFFMKEYDYLVTFETNNSPGVVYQILAKWGHEESQEAKKVTVLKNVRFSKIQFDIIQKDRDWLIAWEFVRISDSVTKVKAYFKDKNHSLSQRFRVLYQQTDFVKNCIKTAKDVRDELNEHAKTYKLSNIEESVIPERFCACESSSTKQSLKASEMIKYNKKLISFLTDNNLSIKEYPLLQVTRWNKITEEIDFEFCFPISQNKEYNMVDGIELKTITSTKALKIVFNGNYMISDRAWYSIIDYAERNHINIDPNPVEFYYNDPHSGTDELNWKTEVFFPFTKYKSTKDSLVKSLNGTPYQSIKKLSKPLADSSINVERQLEKVNNSNTEITRFFSPNQNSILESTKLLFKNTDFVNLNLEFAEVLRIKFNSDYSRSHFAWYAYEDYFETKGENLPILPVEYFLDNPSVGGNEIEWRADVVLPLNQSK